MATYSLNQDNLSDRLFVLLSRWSLVAALSVPAYFALYAVVGAAASNNTLGQQYGGLVQAIRSPILYRLAWLSESLSWLLVGGTLIIFALIFARRAVVRAAFIAACGVGQLTGSFGVFLLSGFSNLAARYTTAPTEQQAFLLQAFLDLRPIIGSPVAIGCLLQGAGFLLVAWVAWEWMGFPRLLAVWLAIPGVLGLALFILIAAEAPATLMVPILLLHDIALIIACVAVAVTFWRRSAKLVADVPNASAVM